MVLEARQKKKNIFYFYFPLHIELFSKLIQHIVFNQALGGRSVHTGTHRHCQPSPQEPGTHRHCQPSPQEIHRERDRVRRGGQVRSE